MHRRQTLSLIALLLTAPRCAAADDEPPQLTVSIQRPGGWHLALLDVTGKKRQVLLDEQTELNFPAWSPDGRQVVFVSGRSGKPQIHRINADGGERLALTQTGADEVQPSWSSDGKKIVFASTRGGNYDVWSMDADGGNPVNLTNNPSFDSDPACSPDGKLIAFASNRVANGGFGAFHVWTMKPDGSEAKQIVARDLFGWVYPHWSPDATQVVFSDRTGDGTWQIFVANVDGQAVEQLSEGAGSNAYASWSPDGRYIAYLHFDKPMNQSPGPGRLMFYDTETATHSPLGADDMRCHASWPAWRSTAGE